MPETSAPARQETLRIVGQSPTHHDFVDKVEGSLLYAADWQLPGMLHGKVVRAQVPCARITAIDVSAARALPGVVDGGDPGARQDRKSTRLNSSHLGISYAVFCLKKKTNTPTK